MTDPSPFADDFEAHRRHLRAVAQRMLGSDAEADDAVQEAWLRLNRSNTAEIDNLRGWLTTVVARICLDMLRARRSRREEPIDEREPVQLATSEPDADPEQRALDADAVGVAMLVVLETLSPAERLAFVLHDMFAVSFDEIAPIVDRSPAATRKLASRARQRVQGTPAAPAADRSRQRQVVDAFIAASRNGDFDALLSLLDPDVVMRADHHAVPAGRPRIVRGSKAVVAQARSFSHRAPATRPALVDGVPGLAYAPGGRVHTILAVTYTADRIAALDVIADPETLRELDVELLEG